MVTITLHYTFNRYCKNFLKYLQRKKLTAWLGPALFALFTILILSSMFGTIDDLIIKPVDTIVYGSNYDYQFSRYDLTLSRAFRLTMLGVFSGLIGGMMGMGGGVVKTSGLMLIFGIEVMLVRTIALLTNIFIYGTAAFKYGEKKGVIIKRVAELMIPGAILGVALGFLIGNILHTVLLKKLLGLFALLSGLDMLRRMLPGIGKKDSEPPEYTDERFRKEKKTRIAGAGFPMGIVMGLFGISGGVIGVPYQRFFLKIPMKNAIANTALTSFIASIFAVIMALGYESMHNQDIWTPILMALCIIPGNILGSRLGATLTGGILPVKFINTLYVILMCIIGVKLFF